MAVGVIDAQKDLAPPGAFILLLYLAQLKQNVLGQQLSAQGSQAGRGQAQPAERSLRGMGPWSFSSFKMELRFWFLTFPRFRPLYAISTPLSLYIWQAFSVT